MKSSRVALVTGASRGVGRGIANALAAIGYTWKKDSQAGTKKRNGGSLKDS
jgi:hypothetical protein